MGAKVKMVVWVGVLCAATASCRAATSPGSAETSAHAGHGKTAPSARSTLLPDLGGHRRTITTDHAEAQRFFDEGLTLLYGFNHEEAYRSFEQAAARDVKAPMPHWGMALALGTNYNDTATPDRVQRAYGHVTEARARSAAGSAVERGLVEALSLRYVERPDDGQQPARERAYSQAMGALSARHPDDLDVATLYAESLMNLRPWKLYDADGEPMPGTEEIVETLEAVLARNPNHPGANHYYIHAVEASRSPQRAMDSAGRLGTLVPGAGHLVHMPAHIYIRTGDYLASAKSNADAARVDEKYVRETGATGMYPTMYYGHNLHFESAALMFAGNLAGARAAAQKLASLVAPMAGDMAMLQPFALQEGLVLIRFGRWDDALALPASPPGRPLQEVYAHFVRGAALAGKGDVSGATAALSALSAAAQRIPDDVMASSSNSARAVALAAEANLRARVADARGDDGNAVEAWTAAAAIDDGLGYAEPPDWLLPARESLGFALLGSGRAEDAERAFRADLSERRDNPRALFGLAVSLDQQHKRAEASAARARFEHAWRGADSTLEDVIPLSRITSR